MYVYILRNSLGKIYIGRTRDLSRRIRQHRSGTCYTSSSLGCLDFKLIHFYTVPLYSDSSRLERYLHYKMKWIESDITNFINWQPAWTKTLQAFVYGQEPLTLYERERDAEQEAGLLKAERFAGSIHWKPYKVKPYKPSISTTKVTKVTKVTNTSGKRSLKEVITEKKLFELFRI